MSPAGGCGLSMRLLVLHGSEAEDANGCCTRSGHSCCRRAGQHAWTDCRQSHTAAQCHNIVDAAPLPPTQATITSVPGEGTYQVGVDVNRGLYVSRGGLRRITRPRERVDEARRNGELCIRPNRPGPRTGLLHDQVTVSVTRPDWPVWS